MNKGEPRELVLPALRGIMGDWVYYSCLLGLDELSSRVQYAAEVHSNKGLSDMIQRRLDHGRSGVIADYLKTQPQRLFASLVVATYGGRPNWHALEDVRNKATTDELKGLKQETVSSIGFLTLRGDETLFALDGQHRLAGIKKVIADGLEQDPYDEVSVIFVAHRKTAEGLQRTRRLFTTLNKTARPVSKGDIIALDEDDVMAICVRRLIEETDLFRNDRIAFVANNNIPDRNRTSLTTIGNLYDVLTTLFTNSRSNLRKNKADLQRVRPTDELLDEYYEYAKQYIFHLRSNFNELEEFFSAETTRAVVEKYRGRHGGKAMFRPIGLEMLTKIICRLTRDVALGEAVKEAAKLPRDLGEAPYPGLMWDSSNQAILNGHLVTLREILCYMIGKNGSNYPAETLLARYRREIGDNSAILPSKLV